MKLSEFESVGEVVLVKEPAWSTVQANLNQFCDLKNGDLLYTKKVAQEYAKANCWELINWYVETTGDVNHAAEMKIWMDDEFGGHEK